MEDQKQRNVEVRLGLGRTNAIERGESQQTRDCDERDLEFYRLSAAPIFKYVKASMAKDFGEPDDCLALEELQDYSGAKRFFYKFGWNNDIADKIEFRKTWNAIGTLVAQMVGAENVSIDYFQCETEASRLFDKAIELLSEGARGSDLNESSLLLEKAVNAGHLQARVVLADLLRRGRLGNPSPDQAAELLTPAADRGYLPAMYGLGCIATDANMHWLAAQWFERASKYNDQASKFRWASALACLAEPGDKTVLAMRKRAVCIERLLSYSKRRQPPVIHGVQVRSRHCS